MYITFNQIYFLFQIILGMYMCQIIVPLKAIVRTKVKFNIIFVIHDCLRCKMKSLFVSSNHIKVMGKVFVFK